MNNISSIFFFVFYTCRFGKHSHDEMSILVPLSQCCRSDFFQAFLFVNANVRTQWPLSFLAITTYFISALILKDEKFRAKVKHLCLIWWVLEFKIKCFSNHLQSEEVDLPAAPAAGQRGVHAQFPDGGVSAAWPSVPRPHPAPPPGHGPPSPTSAAGHRGLPGQRGIWQCCGGRLSWRHIHPQERGSKVVRAEPMVDRDHQ